MYFVNNYNIALLLTTTIIVLYTIKPMLTFAYKHKTLNVYECIINSLCAFVEPFCFRLFFISILYIIFDIEIILLFNWSITLNSISILWLFITLLFFIILGLILSYEWKKAGLDWD